mgnify:CR=1 FL=1
MSQCDPLASAVDVHARVRDIGARIDRARHALAAHGIGGERLDADLAAMSQAQTSLVDKMKTHAPDVAHATLRAQAENLRNCVERWIASNEHRFSGPGRPRQWR